MSDHCGEYDSKEFHDYNKQHGIKRNFATRYTSQQNDVAERKNRTIMNMARSMLKARNLINEYWVEVVACVIYVHDQQISSKECDEQSPRTSMVRFVL